MTFEIRPGRPDDLDKISPWTQNTFSWGDYVADRFLDWLDDDDGKVLVATIDGQPVAMLHAVMLSDDEGWLAAARVHPDHRRRGLGNALNNSGFEWARSRGARVVRLAIEAHNKAPIGQVRALGYRRTSSWTFSASTPDANRASATVHLAPGTRQDVDAAWTFWSSSAAHRAGRGLIVHGWQWRRCTPQDLIDASNTGEFYQSPRGWLIADQPARDVLRVGWLATAPEDALGLMEDINALCVDKGAKELSLKAPHIGWLTEAITRIGGDPSEILIFAKGV